MHALDDHITNNIPSLLVLGIMHDVVKMALYEVMA